MYLHIRLILCAVLSGGVLAGNNRFSNHRNVNYKVYASASEDQPEVVEAAGDAEARAKPGYLYQTPSQTLSGGGSANIGTIATIQTVGKQIGSSATQVNVSAIAEASGIQVETDASHHMAMVTNIQVQCGKERMMTMITFDTAFNGVIYAKGYFKDPACRYVAANTNRNEYIFEMRTGTCGVEFIDEGIKSGGKAYVRGLLIISYENGVEEAWDTAREIRCLWEGNIEQTVTYPFDVNMLDLERLDFNGDTASASLELQVGVGPRSPAVQGMVRIGDMLSAVVKVTGDPDFDLFVHDCVATDGTPSNRIVLTDRQGCAVKPKLMGGWTKQVVGNIKYAYAEMSAFKFPDVMKLYLECAVSLCKGQCQECPVFEPLHDPSKHHQAGSTSAQPSDDGQVSAFDIRSGTGRRKRQAAQNVTAPQESMLLRRGLTVVGPGDLPELYSTIVHEAHSTRASDTAAAECFSMMTIMAGTFVAILLILATIIVVSFLRRSKPSYDDTAPMKFYNPTLRS